MMGEEEGFDTFVVMLLLLLLLLLLRFWRENSLGVCQGGGGLLCFVSYLFPGCFFPLLNFSFCLMLFAMSMLGACKNK